MGNSITPFPNNVPPGTDQYEQWRTRFRDLWWRPAPIGMIGTITLGLVLRVPFLLAISAILLFILTMILITMTLPLAGELTNRWCMDIRYGRREAARRRWHLP